MQMCLAFSSFGLTAVWIVMEDSILGRFGLSPGQNQVNVYSNSKKDRQIHPGQRSKAKAKMETSRHGVWCGLSGRQVRYWHVGLQRERRG
jgi:hypothetical protein